MKIFQPLTLLLLLVVLALAWATWDMQRREAAAPGVDLASLQVKSLPVATTNVATTPMAATNTTVRPPPPPAMAVCPTCRGTREIHVEKEIACKACGGDGIIQGTFSAHGNTVCNACRGSGKIPKDMIQPCPACKSAGQITAAMAANFKACPKCQGTKQTDDEVAIKCANCGGSGKMSSGFHVTNDGHKSSKSKTSSTVAAVPSAPAHGTQVCAFCDGTGKCSKKVKRSCPECFAAGVTYQPPPPPAPPAT